MLLYAVHQPLDMMKYKGLCVEEIRLRESMTEQLPTLAVRGFLSKAENAEGFLAHRLVDRRFEERGLLPIELLDFIDSGKGYLIWTNAYGGAILLV
jgi:hypothetical protein